MAPRAGHASGRAANLGLHDDLNFYRQVREIAIESGSQVVHVETHLQNARLA